MLLLWVFSSLATSGHGLKLYCSDVVVHYGCVSIAFPINAFSLSLREEDPWWRFHYINWWFKRGWISQTGLWRHYSIVSEQNDWKIPFLAEAGSDSQDKSTGMLRPKIEINCYCPDGFWWRKGSQSSRSHWPWSWQLVPKIQESTDYLLFSAGLDFFLLSNGVN